MLKKELISMAQNNLQNTSKILIINLKNKMFSSISAQNFSVEIERRFLLKLHAATKLLKI